MFVSEGFFLFSSCESPFTPSKTSHCIDILMSVKDTMFKKKSCPKYTQYVFHWDFQVVNQHIIGYIYEVEGNYTSWIQHLKSVVFFSSEPVGPRLAIIVAASFLGGIFLPAFANLETADYSFLQNGSRINYSVNISFQLLPKTVS